MTTNRFRVLATLVASMLLLVLGAMAWAQISSSVKTNGRISRQSITSFEEQRTTDSAEWTNIRGLRARTSCPASDVASATVGLELDPMSAPADVRVVMKDPNISCSDCGGKEMTPGSVRFPASTTSFTFATAEAPGEHGSVFIVQWRPAAEPGKATASLNAASLHVLWGKKRTCR